MIGDERRLKQVLINLVKNAKKFTSTGKITVLASYDYRQQLLIVHVKDTGDGIAASDMKKLFKRFGKLQRTASKNSEGIGLGLTIVEAIVTQSGGEVWAHSKGPGKGSTFGFYIKAPLAS